MQKIGLAIFLSVTYLFVSCNSVDSKKYTNNTEVFINISNINQDSVYIEYTINEIQKDSLIFRFPKVIPGAYRINNSSEYVMHISCFDKNSKEQILSIILHSFYGRKSKYDLISSFGNSITSSYLARCKANRYF